MAEAIFLNAADGDLIKEMIDTAVEKFGSLHILVNNVGGNNPQKDLDVVNLDIEEWDRQMNVTDFLSLTNTQGQLNDRKRRDTI